MRNAIYSWSLALLSLGSLAGCESLRTLREGVCGKTQCDSTRSTSTPCRTCQPAPKKLFAVNAESTPIKAKLVETARTPSKLPILEVVVMPPEPEPKLQAVAAPRKIATVIEEEIDQPKEMLIPEVAKPIPKKANADAVKHVVAIINGNPKENSAEIMHAKIQDVQVEAFQSITGKVQPWRKTWRLRFAPIDQDASYGGSVVLEGAGLDRLRDGQTVRVQGVLIVPTDRTSPARYRVQVLDVLD